MSKKLEKNTGKKAAPQKQRKSLNSFMKEVNSELKKVTWPTKQELVSSTLVVLVAVIILSAYVGVVDAIFTKLLSILAL